MAFEWDDAKAETNLQKHGVSFAVAARVFEDPVRLEWFDDRTDYGEERCCAVGEVRGRLLFVAYTVRAENVIRIISARRASPQERRVYHGDRTI